MLGIPEHFSTACHVTAGYPARPFPRKLHRPGVTAPIVGATRPSHLADALAAEQLSLTTEEIAALEELYVPHPVLGRVSALLRRPGAL